MSSDNDDEPTHPDLPSGLGNGDDTTNPGVGTGEAFIAVTSSARRALDAIETLISTCPGDGEVGRERHLEVIAHSAGELGMLMHDFRRITLQLKREEFGR